MKKLITLIIAVLFIATPVLAEDMYIGVGGSYVYEDIDSGISEVDFDDTQGLNLRAGYNINDNLALELTYDYLEEFNWSGYGINADVDIETLMLAVKISAGEEIKPYLTVGAGVMRGKLDVSWLGMSVSESETDLCAKAGVGVDCFVTDDMSIMVEGAYVWGLNDLDDVGYTMITCGVAYHF